MAEIILSWFMVANRLLCWFLYYYDCTSMVVGYRRNPMELKTRGNTTMEY
jgi:hypothetical protein